MQSFSAVPWADIIHGPVSRARLAGRLTVVGVLLTVLGALWAAVTFACFKWMCPALADAIPMFADPHPAV